MASDLKLFIGCSKEALGVASDLRALLKKELPTLTVEIWNETPDWPNMASILDALQEHVDAYFAAVLIGFPDDAVTFRGIDQYMVRDNTLFEFGLFLTRLGKSRTYFLVPELNGADRTMHIPADIGHSIITPRYRLKKNALGAGWTADAPSLQTAAKKVADEITKELDKRSQACASEIVARRQFQSTLSGIASLIKNDAVSDHYLLNAVASRAADVLRLESVLRQKPVRDSVADLLLYWENIDDMLDIAQLARRQHWKNKISKVWVFADEPLEFLAAKGERADSVKALRTTIEENLIHGVSYSYFVSKKFDPGIVSAWVSDILARRGSIKGSIEIVQLESKYFKTYFTVHFCEGNSEIYMSALMSGRSDLLIQISDLHKQRVLDRLKKLHGPATSMGSHVSLYDYVFMEVH